MIPIPKPPPEPTIMRRIANRWTLAPLVVLGAISLIPLARAAFPKDLRAVFLAKTVLVEGIQQEKLHQVNFSLARMGITSKKNKILICEKGEIPTNCEPATMESINRTENEHKETKNYKNQNITKFWELILSGAILTFLLTVGREQIPKLFSGKRF